MSIDRDLTLLKAKDCDSKHIAHNSCHFSIAQSPVRSSATAKASSELQLMNQRHLRQSNGSREVTSVERGASVNQKSPNGSFLPFLNERDGLGRLILNVTIGFLSSLIDLSQSSSNGGTVTESRSENTQPDSFRKIYEIVKSTRNQKVHSKQQLQPLDNFNHRQNSLNTLLAADTIAASVSSITQKKLSSTPLRKFFVLKEDKLRQGQKAKKGQQHSLEDQSADQTTVVRALLQARQKINNRLRSTGSSHDISQGRLQINASLAEIQLSNQLLLQDDGRRSKSSLQKRLESHEKSKPSLLLMRESSIIDSCTAREQPTLSSMRLLPGFSRKESFTIAKQVTIASSTATITKQELLLANQSQQSLMSAKKIMRQVTNGHNSVSVSVRGDEECDITEELRKVKGSQAQIDVMVESDQRLLSIKRQAREETIADFSSDTHKIFLNKMLKLKSRAKMLKKNINQIPEQALAFITNVAANSPRTLQAISTTISRKKMF